MKLSDTVIFVSGFTDKISKAIIIGETKGCWRIAFNPADLTKNVYLFNKNNLHEYGAQKTWYKNRIREVKPEDEEAIERQKLLIKVVGIKWDLQDTSLLREVYSAWKNYYIKRDMENRK